MSKAKHTNVATMSSKKRLFLLSNAREMIMARSLTTNDSHVREMKHNCQELLSRPGVFKVAVPDPAGENLGADDDQAEVGGRFFRPWTFLSDSAMIPRPRREGVWAYKYLGI